MYYIPSNTPIDASTWKFVQHYEDGADLERLDVRQMYRIAELAPAWDCFEPDYYHLMCDLLNMDSDYETCEELMDAVSAKLRIPREEDEL